MSTNKNNCIHEIGLSNLSNSHLIIVSFAGFNAGLMACVEQLKAGNVVAVPTDTIYGIASLAQNTAAVNKIYEIKRRQMKKPVAICVAEVADLYR